jgi:glycosyltransferase involved in cell wall biosynthesis
MRSRRRILFFTTTSSPVGGVETWLDRVCGYLGLHGFDPIVGLARGLMFNIPERFRQYHPDLNSVEIDGRGLNREGRIRALMRCIRRVRPDIVLPLSVVDANDAVMRCKLNGADVKLVVHAQGNLPPMLADLSDYRDGIDMVICPGRLTRHFLVEYASFDPGRVRHVPNGADPPVCPKEPNDDGPIRLGYIGRFTQADKRALDLFSFFGKFSQTSVPFTLTIVGDGPARVELETAFDGATNVNFVGPLPHADVYQRIFPRLDALLLFSASEAFGIVLAEAMMHGVIPVTSRYVGYHAERLVVHGHTGLSFEVGDIDDAVKQVERLWRDPEIRIRLSQRGYEQAIANYTWQQSLSHWHQILEEVTRLSPQRSAPPNRTVDKSRQSRLAAFGTPPALIDRLQRARRFILGPAVPPGGEEWPLFHRTHTVARLNEIAAACRRLDANDQVAEPVDHELDSVNENTPCHFGNS